MCGRRSHLPCQVQQPRVRVVEGKENPGGAVQLVLVRRRGQVLLQTREQQDGRWSHAAAPVRTGSQRTTWRWFQGEVPVDRSIFRSLRYRTLVARWPLERDTCRKTGVSTRGRREDGTSEGHLEDASAPRVQDPDPSVLGGHRQPAAIGAEAGGEQKRLGGVALVDGPQEHPDGTPEEGTRLGHVPEEHLRGRDRNHGSGVEDRPQTGGADLVVVGGAEQQVLGRRMPLDEAHPPGVSPQGGPGLGEAPLDAARRDVPNPHLKPQTEA